MNIQKAKQALLNKAKELASHTVSKDEIAIEPAAEMMDGLQNATDRVLALDILSRNWHTKLLVDEALQRVAAGTFGTCESCEEPIPDRRLEAIPWAKFCVRCQEAADHSRDDDAEFQIAA